jgi:hypothetical protein
MLASRLCFLLLMLVAMFVVSACAKASPVQEPVNVRPTARPVAPVVTVTPVSQRDQMMAALDAAWAKSDWTTAASITAGLRAAFPNDLQIAEKAFAAQVNGGDAALKREQREEAARFYAGARQIKDDALVVQKLLALTPTAVPPTPASSIPATTPTQVPTRVPPAAEPTKALPTPAPPPAPPTPTPMLPTIGDDSKIGKWLVTLDSVLIERYLYGVGTQKLVPQGVFLVVRFTAGNRTRETSQLNPYDANLETVDGLKYRISSKQAALRSDDDVWLWWMSEIQPARFRVLKAAFEVSPKGGQFIFDINGNRFRFDIDPAGYAVKVHGSSPSVAGTPRISAPVPPSNSAGAAASSAPPAVGSIGSSLSAADLEWLSKAQGPVDGLGKAIQDANQQIDAYPGSTEGGGSAAWRSGMQAAERALTTSAVALRQLQPGPRTAEVHRIALQAASRADEAAAAMTAASTSGDGGAARLALVRVLGEINAMNMALLKLQ